MPNSVQPLSRVLYSEKRNAKQLKTFLEERKWLDKNFRLLAVETSVDFVPLKSSIVACNSVVEQNKMIAIPVVEDILDNIHDSDEIYDKILGHGYQNCAFSSSVIGSGKKRMLMEKKCDHLNFAQNILLSLIQKQDNVPSDDDEMLVARIQKICPTRLEVFGDDRTLVIPFKSLNLQWDEHFKALLMDAFDDNDEDIEKFMIALWEHLAQAHGSERIVRRGEIDPRSKIRQSGHSIIWIKDQTMYVNESGPGSKGWITVTEQGIKQSFDLTLVMFSRGNISEKIRFGKLVKPNELVLDMYAGIGYYTLPALIHGKAKHVYACEWNKSAVAALRYNLLQNGVSERATVLEGDCRIRLKEEQILDQDFDRISLGLLPSSEGGWRIAIKALNKAKGGWLHIHGNVPSTERDEWALWVCQRLSVLYGELYNVKPASSSVYVLCNHIERVKSFAPRVDHYVADIFVGPIPFEDLENKEKMMQKRGIINPDGSFRMVCPDNPLPLPSCALGNGIIDQEWMLELPEE